MIEFNFQYLGSFSENMIKRVVKKAIFEVLKEMKFKKKYYLSVFLTNDSEIKKINKKVRKLALAQTLSKKCSDKRLHILADIKKEIKKTKDFNNFLEKNNLLNSLIISDSDSLKNIDRSTRNIKNLKLIKYEGTNIYDLIKYKNVIITSTSAKKIEERYLNEKN